MKEMVGGCCVCSDERGFFENPLVYCDGQGCNVAVHQGNYYSILFSIIYYSLFCISMLWNCPSTNWTMVLSKMWITRTSCSSGNLILFIIVYIQMIIFKWLYLSFSGVSFALLKMVHWKGLIIMDGLMWYVHYIFPKWDLAIIIQWNQ